MSSRARRPSRVAAELRFAGWDAQVRGTLFGERFDAWLRRTCPDLPDYQGRHVTFTTLPSLIAAFVLRAYLPFLVCLKTWSLHSVGIALVGGRLISALAERCGLRRLDTAYEHWWERRARMPSPYVARVVAAGERMSRSARRWAAATLAAGGMLAALAIGLRALTGTSVVSAPVGACALVLLVVAMLLAVVLLTGGIVETLAPMVLGPPSVSAHIVSREELRGLRPLLATWPAKLARDGWELLRTLRP